MIRRILQNIYKTFSVQDAPYEHLGQIVTANLNQTTNPKSLAPIYTTGLFSINMIQSLPESTEEKSGNEGRFTKDSMVQVKPIQSVFDSEEESILKEVVDLPDDAEANIPLHTQEQNTAADLQEKSHEEELIFANDIFKSSENDNVSQQETEKNTETYEPSIDWDKSIQTPGDIKTASQAIDTPLAEELPLPNTEEASEKNKKKRSGKVEKTKSKKKISKKKTNNKKKSSGQKSKNKGIDTFVDSNRNIHNEFTSWVLALKPLEDSVRKEDKQFVKKKKKKHQAVLESAKNSLTLSDEIATESLAKIYIKQGHNEKASEILDRLIELYPKDKSKFETLKSKIRSK